MDTNTLDISKLSPEQIALLAKQLRTASRAKSGDPKNRNAIIDKLLQEKDGKGFKNTTQDILDAMIAAKVVKADADRKIELKKIQTRKQFLVKKPKTDAERAAAKLLYGYKVSANGFAVTIDRVLEWIKTATPDERKQVAKAIKG